MRIRVLSSAEQEIAEVVDYYNEQEPGSLICFERVRGPCR